MKRILCAIIGHRWVEVLPHRMWTLNDYYCVRCTKTKREGIYVWVRP